MIQLGNILTGRLPFTYVVNKVYDWEYRLCWIKANADYSEFYHLCPLQGPIFLAATLIEAMDKLDEIHEQETKPEIDYPENVERVYFGEEIPF